MHFWLWSIWSVYHKFIFRFQLFFAVSPNLKKFFWSVFSLQRYSWYRTELVFRRRARKIFNDIRRARVNYPRGLSCPTRYQHAHVLVCERKSEGHEFCPTAFRKSEIFSFRHRFCITAIDNETQRVSGYSMAPPPPMQEKLKNFLRKNWRFVKTRNVMKIFFNISSIGRRNKKKCIRSSYFFRRLISTEPNSISRVSS